MVFDLLYEELSNIYGQADIELVKLVCFVLTTYFIFIFVSIPVKALKYFLQIEDVKRKKKRW